MIQVNSNRDNDSPSNDLHTVEKSHDSIAQIKRAEMANFVEVAEKSPETRLRIRAPSNEMNDISTTGESSPGQGVHLTTSSTLLEVGIAGDVKSGQVTRTPISIGDETLSQMNTCDKDNIPEVWSWSGRIMNMLNQGNNHDMNCTSIQRKETMQQENKECNPKETTAGNGQGNIQGNQQAMSKQSNAVSKDKRHTSTIMEKQKDTGEANWKLNPKAIPEKDARQQSDEERGNQQNNRSMEAGKSINLVHNSNGNQNEHEKDDLLLRA
ncbi:hypothetical protein H5410_050965 [Solanum commersonii]|uniref:Uncharacterized protein n=1 Tax=Solanum commersonii TaxID=4109 RepID=A0A9J5WX27_SOLCO|nr:hypothetical protein H5410_050965 [Solanum commersonii]